MCTKAHDMWRTSKIYLKEQVILMKKKKSFSLLKFLIVLLCLIFIAFGAAVNFLFSQGKTPVILDNYIYIVKESDNMSNFLSSGTALISPSAKNLSVAKGDIVICYPSDSPETLKLRSIYQIDIDDSGISRFTTADGENNVSEETITKDNIAAICTGHNASAELGQLIIFAQDIKGIIALIAVPALILLIFLIAKIVSSKDDDEVPEDYDFYEYDDSKDEDTGRKNHSHRNTVSHEKKQSAPLFENANDIQPSTDLELKKMSIAENFSQKKVNPNSPYQKEKERTMQFKAQLAAKGEGFSNTSPAPTADTLRDEILKKQENAAAEPQIQSSIRQPETAPVQPAEEKPAAPVKPPYVPKKSTTPDISDIVGKNSPSERKKAANSSVDDLIKLIEDQKKKL